MNTNAKQFKITGTVILFNRTLPSSSSNTNRNDGLLIAEGGAKAIKKFCHVLEQRIGWHLRFEKKENDTSKTENNNEMTDDQSDQESDDDDDDAKKNKKCQFMWRGTIEQRSFKFFKSQQVFNDEESARNYLGSFGVSHYVDHLHSSGL